MKIGITGASGAELARIKRVMAKMGCEVITLPDDDVKESNEREVTTYCGHPSLNVGAMPECYDLVSMPKIDNSFRGGSIGKGGKVKYRRG
jgi:hypothetical protein